MMLRVVNGPFWLRVLSGISVLAWMGLIFYLSSLSGPDVSKPLETGAISWLGEWRTYVGHIVLYAILAALIQGAVWGWRRGSNLRWVIVVAVISSLFGVSDEYHQSFVIGRSATVADALIDAIASTVSATLIFTLSTGRVEVRIIR